MRIWGTRHSLLDTLLEIIGIKPGLLLPEDRLVAILDQTHDSVDEVALILGGSQKWWQGEPEGIVGIRAEELEANFILAMHSIGAIPDRRVPYELVVDFVRQNANRLDIDGLDPRAVSDVGQQLLVSIIFGGEIPKEAEELVIEYQKRHILNRTMPVCRQWDGMIPLNDLFESEDIPPNTTSEHYFDQRYIDYLGAQPHEIERIHWRQFEFLTAEFFRRHGYLVTITPPRGDGGVDVIVKREGEIVGPDLIVIQCRRYARDNSVSLDEVKAFWTTVGEHGATKGLVVTTSRLTRGGRVFVEARKYRLSVVEGENVKKWINALSSRTRATSQVADEAATC